MKFVWKDNQWVWEKEKKGWVWDGMSANSEERLKKVQNVGEKEMWGGWERWNAEWGRRQMKEEWGWDTENGEDEKVHSHKEL